MALVSGVAVISGLVLMAAGILLAAYVLRQGLKKENASLKAEVRLLKETIQVQELK